MEGQLWRSQKPVALRGRSRFLKVCWLREARGRWARLTCAYNMLQYLLRALPAPDCLSRTVTRNIRGESPDHKFLSDVDNSAYAEANKEVFER